MVNPSLKGDSWRFSLRHLFVCVAVVAVLAGIARFANQALHSVFKPFETYSAVWLTHDMLISHMMQTNGDWPTRWSDLKPQFASINPKAYGEPDLDGVRSRVTIDFDFDPSSLVSSEATRGNQAQAMRMADGTDNREIRRANERIQSFIRSRYSP